MKLQKTGSSIASASLYGNAADSNFHKEHKSLVIGVAGGTASGKTSVCKFIIEGLKEELKSDQAIVSISQDCFYKDLTPEQSANFAAYNFDHPDAFDFEETLCALQLLKAGLPVEIPQYDYTTSSRRASTTTVNRTDVVLFDGILAFYHPEVRRLMDMKIFVDADADTRLARRIRRDILYRGRDISSVLDQYERTVKPSFESYVLPTKKYADIIVPRGIENTVAVNLLLQHVKMKLAVQ